MEIIFTRSRNRWNQTIATRLDGVRVRVPVFGPLDPIPHDLAHYVIERALGLHDGFWGRVAAGALFGGMSVVNGRQKPHAGERSRALIAANPYAIGFAEVIVGAVLHAVKGEALGPEALAIASPVAPSRTRAERDALVARLRPAVEAMCTRWRETPPGGTLRVMWPEQRIPHRRHRLGSRQRPAKAAGATAQPAL